MDRSLLFLVQSIDYVVRQAGKVMGVLTRLVAPFANKTHGRFVIQDCRRCRSSGNRSRGHIETSHKEAKKTVEDAPVVPKMFQQSSVNGYR